MAANAMTSAVFYRSAAWVFLTTILVALILSSLSLAIGADRLNDLLHLLPVRVLLGSLGVTGAFGIIALWIGMIWNCLSLSNESKAFKISWFLLIVLTNMLGALIYYFTVYRRKSLTHKGAFHEAGN